MNPVPFDLLLLAATSSLFVGLRKWTPYGCLSLRLPLQPEELRPFPMVSVAEACRL